MKRLFIGLMVMALGLCLSGGAFAKTAKMPKQICLQNENIGANCSPTNQNDANKICLAPKMSGTINLVNGPRKYYIITGEVIGTGYRFPVNGSGYVVNDNFHFTITGFVYITGWDYGIQYHAEGMYPLGTGSAGVSFHYLEFNPGNNFPFIVIDCASVPSQ